MKKLLSILLSTIMLLSAIIIVPTASAKEIRSGDYSYKFLDDGTISITRYYGRDKNLKLPEEIDGYKVTKISNYAFSPRGFALLNKFDSVVISNTIVTIGIDAFLDCKIKAFRFGNNVRYISNTPLREGIVCDKIKVPKNNKYFTSKSGVLFTKSMDKIMLYPQYKKGSRYTIPNGVKTTATCTFLENRYLKTVKFPKTLTSIGECAFAFSRIEKLDLSGNIKVIKEQAFLCCEKLKSIHIPKNIVSVEKQAFARCTNVSKITFDANKNLSINSGAFANIDKLKTLTVPNVSGDSVFVSCGNLQKITIPSNVKTITKEEFWDCQMLKTVTVPKTVTKIGDYSLGYKDNDWDGGSEKIKGFTIKGKKGSTAHKYAKKNGFKFVAI